jgi:UDP-N-acetylmuramoyl-tripeptide--D-alanyl-D-alanine ligase
LQALTLSSGVALINDAYNANPASMAVAIEVLAAHPAPRYLVIGDMAELGEAAAQAHQRVGELAADKGIEELWVCGELSAHAALAFGVRARRFDDAETLARHLREELPKHGTVLVKGSRSAAMERVVHHLEEMH